jgi:hypothetical protein
MNNIYYLETSAVNRLADEVDDFDFLNFLQRALKIDFCVSSVVLWEVLLNSSASRKERLLFWLQSASSSYLLKSPSEILVAYLEAGLPLKDRKAFWYDRASKQNIARVWAKIHRKIERTLLGDLEELKERTAPLRQLSKLHTSLLDAMTDSGQEGYDDDYFHGAMLRLAGSLESDEDFVKNHERDVKTSLILAFYLVAIGVDLDNSPIQEFWATQHGDVSDPFERLEILISQYPKLFVRGPLAEMSLMMDMQSARSRSVNRGMIHDSLHTIYCYYSDNFVTDDAHFLELQAAGISSLFDGIISAEKFVSMLYATREKAVELFTHKE